jgi:hypothetical protein
MASDCQYATPIVLGRRALSLKGSPEALFCENESNTRRLWGLHGPRYPKDGINDHVVNGAETVNPPGPAPAPSTAPPCRSTACWSSRTAPPGWRSTARTRSSSPTSGLFGGNSNWRGPIWFPINYLLVETLRVYHRFFRNEFTVEFPTGSGRELNLGQIADELSGRLIGIFLGRENGTRPVFGGYELQQRDPAWHDLIPFHEYFHPDHQARALNAPPGPQSPDERAVRPDDEPEAAELGDVLAEDLSGGAVADVVERLPGIGHLEPAAGATRLAQEGIPRTHGSAGRHASAVSAASPTLRPIGASWSRPRSRPRSRRRGLPRRSSSVSPSSGRETRGRRRPPRR